MTEHIDQTLNNYASSGLGSTSLNRAPAPQNNFVRGKPGNVPFWPGGLEEDIAVDAKSGRDASRNNSGLRTVPPGFQRGLRLPVEDISDPFSQLEAISVEVTETSENVTLTSFSLAD